MEPCHPEHRRLRNWPADQGSLTMVSPAFIPIRDLDHISTIEADRFNRWEHVVNGDAAFKIRSHLACLVVTQLAVILIFLGH